MRRSRIHRGQSHCRSLQIRLALSVEVCPNFLPGDLLNGLLNGLVVIVRRELESGPGAQSVDSARCRSCKLANLAAAEANSGSARTASPY